jgi:hypothetical protein
MALRPCTSDDGNFLGESNEERGVERPILERLASTLVPLFPLVM